MLKNAWRKSKVSNGNGGNNCVEARFNGKRISVRNSKRPDGPVVQFTVDEWTAFLQGVRTSDEFDVEAE